MAPGKRSLVLWLGSDFTVLVYFFRLWVRVGVKRFRLETNFICARGWSEQISLPAPVCVCPCNMQVQVPGYPKSNSYQVIIIWPPFWRKEIWEFSVFFILEDRCRIFPGRKHWHWQSFLSFFLKCLHRENCTSQGNTLQLYTVIGDTGFDWLDYSRTFSVVTRYGFTVNIVR